MPPAAGLLDGNVARARGDRREGEVGRPPLGRPVWLRGLWPSGDDRELTIRIGSIIRKMLLVVRLWEDLVGAEGVELSLVED